MKRLYLTITLILVFISILLAWLAIDEPLDPEAAAWLDEVESFRVHQQKPSDEQLYLIGLHSISRAPIDLGRLIYEQPWTEQPDALLTPGLDELASLLDCRDPNEKRCQAIPKLIDAHQALLDNYEDWRPREMPLFLPHLLHGAELWLTAEQLSMLDFLWKSIADTGRPCEECQYESLEFLFGLIQKIEDNIELTVLTVLLNQRLDFVLELAADGIISLQIERLDHLARPFNEHGFDPKTAVMREYSNEGSIVRMYERDRTGFVEGFGVFWFLERVLRKPNASINYLYRAYSEHLSWTDPVQYVRYANPDQLPSDDQRLPLRNRHFLEFPDRFPGHSLGKTFGLYHDKNARLILLSYQLRGLEGQEDWEEEAAKDNPFGEGFGLFTDESRSKICYEGPPWTQQDIRCIPRNE